MAARLIARSVFQNIKQTPIYCCFEVWSFCWKKRIKECNERSSNEKTDGSLLVRITKFLFEVVI